MWCVVTISNSGVSSQTSLPSEIGQFSHFLATAGHRGRFQVPILHHDYTPSCKTSASEPGHTVVPSDVLIFS